MIHKMIRVCSAFFTLGFVTNAWACIGCGQQSYTPRMLLVGSLFALLPMGLVAFIAWLLVRDSRENEQ